MDEDPLIVAPDHRWKVLWGSGFSTWRAVVICTLVLCSLVAWNELRPLKHLGRARLAVNDIDVLSEGMARLIKRDFDSRRRFVPVDWLYHLKSRALLKKALDRLHMGSDDKALDEIYDSLTVRLLPGSRVIEIALVHSSKRAAVSILSEVIDIKTEEELQRVSQLGKKMLESLRLERIELTKQLAEVATKINAIQDQIPGPQPELLTQVDLQLVELESTIARLTAQQESLKGVGSGDEGNVVGFLPDISESAMRDLGTDGATYFGLRSSYDQMSVEYARAKSVYGPNHPDHRRAEDNLRDLVRRIEDYLKAAREKVSLQLETAVREHSVLQEKREAMALDMKERIKMMSEEGYEHHVLVRASLLSRLEVLGAREDQVQVYQKIRQPALIVVDAPRLDVAWSARHVTGAHAFAVMGTVLLFFFFRITRADAP